MTVRLVKLVALRLAMAAAGAATLTSLLAPVTDAPPAPTEQPPATIVLEVGA